MGNGFEINITEHDFKSKPIEEQNWILFQGITSTRKCVEEIDNEGCAAWRGKGHAKDRKGSTLVDMARALGAGIGGAVIAGYAVWQTFCGK